MKNIFVFHFGIFIKKIWFKFVENVCEKLLIIQNYYKKHKQIWHSYL